MLFSLENSTVYGSMCRVRGLCVVGLGLIGGSVLRAADAAGWEVWGSGIGSDAEAAAAGGYRVLDLPQALRQAAEVEALVLLAVPLPAVDEILIAVEEHAPAARLTDVISVKAPVADAVRRAAPRARYIGGHPMAGSAESGWKAGSAELFRGASWAISTTASGEDGSMDIDVWSEVATLALDCGAHVVPVEPAAHDAAVARISHLPHVLAAVLASVGTETGPLALTLAAGSFADGTRVAGSEPGLVLSMCEGNAAALLPALDEALGRLGAARGAFASTGSLEATIAAGHAARARWDEHRARQAASGVPVRIDLYAPEAPQALLGIGEQGGWITALRTGVAIAAVPRSA